MSIRRPLKLCVLIPGFADGGAQRQCIRLLNELQMRSDVSVTLIYLHEGVHDDALKRDHLEVIRLPVISNYDPRNVFRLWRILRERQPDILMSWLHACDTYAFFLKRTHPKLRWIMTERDSHYPLDPRFLLRRLVGRHADAIVANSRKGADYWQKAGAHCPIHVVPNIVETPAGHVVSARRGGIVTVGRLAPQKNAATVIAAFAELARRRPSLEFFVIGDGVERAELEAAAAACGAAAKIEFLGFRKDAGDWIRSSDLVVSMSHHEGLPNVMLEAAAAGTPVVASDIAEHRELFGDDYPHLVADRTNPIAVADAMELALDDVNARTALEGARVRIRTMTSAAVADRYLDIFREFTEAAACS